MSAIRPNLPSFPTPLSQTPVPVRAARSDFFKAALDAVQASAAEPAVSAAVPASANAVREEQPPRPGALLDIRV
ncbi:MAG: hypothetical protein FD125_782 [bacterium]|nr:MAG: hypothetical protein FD125_782 [bacterium]